MTQTQLAEPLQSPAEAILNSAMQLIAELGFSAMSMRCLARKLGLQPGSLYHHFKSKAEMLEQVLENIIDQRFERWQCARPKGATPSDLLTAFVTFHVNDQLTVGRVEGLVLSEMRHLGEDQRARLAQERDRYLLELITIIAGCTGRKHHDSDLRLMATSVILLLDSAPELIARSQITLHSQAVSALLALTYRLLRLEGGHSQRLRLVP
ncbi:MULTISPECIES: TetR/AcrR family transcriptional regulator [unclassified Pseudomonas]|uniref:TetR/AcrR family transcriptional regulator n=1 Tax=unclassified Pseudomonas TaxID=196821 RepID=UPI000D333D07|nr:MULTISPECIES: TetR/AcrR family transcriptional regulator [unclassified Pseudomonas]RAU43822.1 TetR/AcrR family transcriptional regulator [Pseudomonas sp. RIT 409]RAU56284.1 TetR/AcrR family transcriptional regulator [Pseudomonas sp. RIT 412]